METKLANYLVLVAMMASSASAEYYCGRANACYMVPSGCAYGDCDFEVVWSQQENTTKYDFKIAARHDGWVAVGFSHDKAMGSDDVLMCIADGSGARFEHRYNNGRSNVAGTGEGVLATETRNNEGVISCRVERDLNVTNMGVTFDLDTDMHMFFGKGSLLAGSPVQHDEIPKITKEKIDFSELVVLGSDDFEDLDDPQTGDSAAVQRAGMLLIIVISLLGLTCGRQ